MVATCSSRTPGFRSGERGEYDDAVRYGRRIAASLAFVACASVVAGCLVDRSPLTAPPAPPRDAAGLDAATPDAYVPPGVDAWTEMPDAYVELPDAVDIPVDATQCDSVGDPCCGGGSCNGGLFCLNDGRCGTACGSAGQPCCYMGVCLGSNGCEPATGTCEPCGLPGQVCCGVAPRCSGASACVDAHCRACGGDGEACCDGGGCTGSLGCSDGTCRPGEGTRGGSCRLSAMPCDALSYCDLFGGSICRGCGMRDEGCCPGGPECGGGLSCRGPAWDRSCVP